MEAATIATARALSTAFVARGGLPGRRDWLLSAPLSAGRGHAPAGAIVRREKRDGGVTEWSNGAV